MLVSANHMESSWTGPQTSSIPQKKGTPETSPWRRWITFSRTEKIGISLILNKHRPRSQLKNSKPSAHKKKNAGLQDPTPRIVKCLIPFGNVPIILNLRGVKLESHQLWSPWGWWCYRNAMVRSLSAVCGGIPVSLSWGQLHRNRMLKNFKIFVFLDPQRFFLQRSVDPPFKNKRSMNYLESSQTYPQN